LKSQGSLLLEIGAGHAELLREELKNDPFFDLCEFHRDYSGILRVLHVRKGGGS
jgi:methylase of polypeptide subunit release factors